MTATVITPKNRFKVTIAALLFFIGTSFGSIAVQKVQNQAEQRYAAAHPGPGIRERVRVVKVPTPFVVEVPVPGATQTVALPKGYKYIVVREDGSDVGTGPGQSQPNQPSPPTTQPQPKPDPNQTTVNVPVPPPKVPNVPTPATPGKPPIVGVGPVTQEYTGDPGCVVSYTSVCVMEPSV